jgi:DNA repair exonuclease SbcCD nuclease subunit
MSIFIHTSDWHIGNSFSHFSQDMKKRLNNAILLTVESIYLYARKQDIPLVLCAGDCIDNGQVTDEEHLKALFRIFRKYPEIKTIMIAGNHDPLVSNNIYSRVHKDLYPENLFFVQEDEVIDLPEFQMKIFASSIREKYGDYNPLHWITPSDFQKETIHIGLAHGNIILSEKYRNNPFPIEPDFAKKMKLDYLAMGDWHSFKKINDHTYYPGAPEPLQFNDDGYPLRVRIDKPGDTPVVEEITGINQFNWKSLDIEISNSNLEEFKRDFETIRDKEIRKITISGFLSAERYKLYKELLDLHKERYHQIIDQVSLEPNQDELLNIKDSYIRGIVERLINLKKDPELFPGEVTQYIAHVGKTEVEDTTDKISNNDIIDRALTKLYKHIRI